MALPKGRPRSSRVAAITGVMPSCAAISSAWPMPSVPGPIDFLERDQIGLEAGDDRRPCARMSVRRSMPAAAVDVVGGDAQRDVTAFSHLVLEERRQQLLGARHDTARPPALERDAIADPHILVEDSGELARRAPRSWNDTLLSSLNANERLSKFAVPIVAHAPSTTIVFWCSIVRLYS